MRVLPKTGWVAAPLLVLLALGCEGNIKGVSPAASAGGGGLGSDGPQNLAGGAMLPPGTEVTTLLPARIRRLADAEYQASVKALVPEARDDITADFIPDSRQNGFTLNEAQRVDPVFAGQLAAAAVALAANVRSHVAERAPCANPSTDAESCATKFIQTFGEEAYRRPLASDEVEHLTTVFRAAYEGGTYEDGIELVVRAMLQSAAFLYLTEIGDGLAATVKLTPYELASSFSYLVQGQPPSKALVQKALAGKLDTPEGRYEVAHDADLKLFQGVNAQIRTARVVNEWLGTDRIAETAKDSNAYPAFAGVKAALEKETTLFLSDIVAQPDGGSLAQLLAGGFSEVNKPLADAYGVNAPGADDGKFVRVDTPARLGILNKGAFLSVFAHATETAPVLRGVAIMRRVACDQVGNPINLDMAIVPPAPDPSKTTRERYAVHGTSAACAGCHKRIDNYGFAFEGFDGMGKARTMEHDNQPVDTGVVVAGTDFAGSYADSNALVKAMSTSTQVRQCFARHVYRALSATSALEAQPSEDDFVKYWGTVAEANGQSDAKIIPTLVTFLTNPSFAYRRGQ